MGWDSLPNALACELGLSAMSRSRRMPPRYWQREWKKDTSILRRFGPTLRHSRELRDSFVERWTASLRDTRASRSVRPASGEGSRIRDTFSRIYDEWCAQSSLFSASSRTCVDTCRLDSMQYRGAYSEMATRWSAEYSARQKLGRAIGESDCSYWPTAAAVEDGSGVKDAVTWPTPSGQVVNDGESLETWRARRDRNLTKHVNGNGMETPLTIAAAQWPTPNVPNGGRKLAPEWVATRGSTPHGKAQVELENAVEFWSTPQAHDVVKGDPARVNRYGTEHGGRNLTDDAALWATPRTITGGGESGARKQELGRTESGGGDLQAQATMWPTPASRDAKGDNSELHLEIGGGRKHLDQLPNFVTHIFQPSHRDPQIMKRGEPSSHDGRNSRPPLTIHCACGHTFTGELDTNCPECGMVQSGSVTYPPERGGMWPTATVLSGAQTKERRSPGQTGSTTLAGQAETGNWPTPNAPEPQKSRKKLNPNFVDWMMNFLPGWSSVQIDCGQEEMQLWRSRQRTHLSRLLKRRES